MWYHRQYSQKPFLPLRSPVMGRNRREAIDGPRLLLVAQLAELGRDMAEAGGEGRIESK